MPQIVEMQIKKNVATTLYVSLQSQTGVVAMQANPTLAAGDVKHTGDGGALANLGTLPAVEPAGSKIVKVTLAQTETNYTLIGVIFSDAAGAEWHDLIISIRTTAVTVDDLVRSSTPANALIVDADGRAACDVQEISGDATAADNLESYCDGTTPIPANMTQISADATAADTLESYCDGTTPIPANMTQISGDAAAADALETYTDGGALMPVNVTQISGDAVAADNCELMFDGTGYAGGTAKLDVNAVQVSGGSVAADNLESYCDGTTPIPANVTQISGDVTAADNAELAFDGTGYGFTACVMPTVTAITNDVGILLSKAISEGQTARTVGGALEAGEAYRRNKVIHTNSGTSTVYRSDNTTPLIARTHTVTGDTAQTETAIP